ncbi:MAG: serpin family protein [Acutalibacteraceae bacterium]|nr:serpin family protein [Acutalibacteraceae bacterium]
MRKALRITAILLCVSLLLCGCGGSSSADLMTGIVAQKVSVAEDVSAFFIKGQFDLSASLLKEISATENDNFMISALSLSNSLGMVLNGAKGETADEISGALFANNGTEHYNKALYTYSHSIGKELSSLNSVWYRNDNRLSVEKNFLQNCADYYGAAARKIDFNEDGRKLINDWVKESTAGKIDGIVDKIEENSVMYLINALTFESPWSSQYPDNAVKTGEFTTSQGNKVSVDMMTSRESAYIEYNGAKGFVKPYAMANYLFAAVLPPENMDINEYISYLSGDDIKILANGYRGKDVTVTLPKFSFEYTLEANTALEKAGIKTAFDMNKADFSAMGKMKNKENIYLSKVIHKTYIKVDNQGTSAGAVSNAEMAVKTSLSDAESLVFDRPFVFMILDGVYNIPVFIGVVNNPVQ